MATVTKQQKKAGSIRLEARFPLKVKEDLEHAAAIAGYKTVASFVVRTMQERAQEVLDSHRATQLSAEESIRFVNSLLKPAAPNAALKRAFKRHLKESESA